MNRAIRKLFKRSRKEVVDSDPNYFWNIFAPDGPTWQRRAGARISEDRADAIQRIRDEVAAGTALRRSLLTDLGLSIQEDDGERDFEDLDSSKLVSVVPQLDRSMEPRPELWEIISDDETIEEDPKGSWPARLLHIPSMTSHEWQQGNVYAGNASPPYATISYTWGRWRLPHNHYSPHPALAVTGITWRVPPVDPTLFTVDEFGAVLNEISRLATVDYVWLDVACIDQNDGSIEGTTEIGRQAKIFKTAKESFIWLVGSSDQDPEQSPKALFDKLIATSRLAAGPISGDSNSSENNSTKGRVEAAELYKAIQVSNHPWIMNTSLCVGSIVSYPWFSSLWTLQEAFLQPEARLLDRSGRCISDSFTYVTLRRFLDICSNLRDLTLQHIAFMAKLDRYGDNADHQIIEKSFIRTINKAGLDALAEGDRMALYTCVKARQTTQPLDRIYGIMQIWDFRLGVAAPNADVTLEWSLGKLEIELGKHLISTFRMESQLTVHSESVINRQSWRVSNSSTIPDDRLNLPVLNDALQFRAVGDSILGHRANGIVYGYFHGMVCEFDTVYRAWIDYQRRKQTPKSQGLIIRIALDESPLLNRTTMRVDYFLQKVSAGNSQLIGEA